MRRMTRGLSISAVDLIVRIERVMTGRDPRERAPYGEVNRRLLGLLADGAERLGDPHQPIVDLAHGGRAPDKMQSDRRLWRRSGHAGSSRRHGLDYSSTGPVLRPIPGGSLV